MVGNSGQVVAQVLCGLSCFSIHYLLEVINLSAQLVLLSWAAGLAALAVQTV